MREKFKGAAEGIILRYYGLLDPVTEANGITSREPTPDEVINCLEALRS